MIHWPDINIEPINLWSAPWMGRPYHGITEAKPVPRSATPGSSTVGSEVVLQFLRSVNYL